MQASAQVVGRLAPSPTGLLHLGHARSFLLAYWSARQKSGRLVLRLEDLDDERAAERYIEATLRDLEWLGLDWDGTARRQSLELGRIRGAAIQLADSGRAYACTCTRADVRAALNAPQAGTTELRYSGRCRGRYPTLAAAKAQTGQDPALRFAVPDSAIEVTDAFVGIRRFDVAADCGDFLILRRNQLPSYQLAVVVDDAADGVTEVVRGDDLLASAARQRLLQVALGAKTPHFYHVPLVVDPEGKRLAKRTDALSLESLRQCGIDPKSIVGWVARRSGWPNVDRASPAELIASFDWTRVPRSQVVVDARALASQLV